MSQSICLMAMQTVLSVLVLKAQSSMNDKSVMGLCSMTLKYDKEYIDL